MTGLGMTSDRKMFMELVQKGNLKRARFWKAFEAKISFFEVIYFGWTFFRTFQGSFFETFRFLTSTNVKYSIYQIINHFSSFHTQISDIFKKGCFFLQTRDAFTKIGVLCRVTTHQSSCLCFQSIFLQNGHFPKAGRFHKKKGTLSLRSFHITPHIYDATTP